MRSESSTMTIYNGTKTCPFPLPNPPSLGFLFKMHSVELLSSELLSAVLYTDAVFQVTSPLSASVFGIALCDEL